MKKFNSKNFLSIKHLHHINHFYKSSYLFLFFTLFYLNSLHCTELKAYNHYHCNSAGSINALSIGPCICKKNVFGLKCDQCKPGTFNLDITNPDGCTECFCFKISSNRPIKCKSSNFGVKIITSDFQSFNSINERNNSFQEKNTFNSNFENQRLQEWKILNLTALLINKSLYKLAYEYQVKNSLDYDSEINQQYEVTYATIDLKNDFNEIIQPFKSKYFLAFNDDDVFNLNLFYWQAPEQYLGNKLLSYGNELQFKIAYSVLRGDVSENKYSYNLDPDVILGGLIDNKLQFIGLKWIRYEPKFKVDSPITIRIKIREHEWFKLNKNLKITNQKINRLEFTLLINSLNFLLIRASYHTKQIEAQLYMVTLGFTDTSKKVQEYFQAKNTEQCECDDSENGISCESCKPGYRRLNKIKNLAKNETACIKCDCNDNAFNCDTECQCINNTDGKNCEKCAKGYYGNPLKKIKCKPCNCPFQTDCINLEKSFECTNCPIGYKKPKCETCDYGYFGNTFIGQSCQPCYCAQLDVYQPGNCDTITGQCRCLNNTIGKHCEYCAEGFYKKYNQKIEEESIKHSFNCEPCNCSKYGSMNNGSCASSTGQCRCKLNFDGLKCDQCALGYENYELKCQSCDCKQSSLSGNCINNLINDINLLKEISKDYSFNTLRSLPVIKLNYFKDSLNKKQEKIKFWLNYEQHVRQVLTNETKLVPVLSGKFDMGADVAFSLCKKTENIIEEAIIAGNRSDYLFHRLNFLNTELNYLIHLVNATRKVQLNENQRELYLKQSDSMLKEMKDLGLELNEFFKPIKQQLIDSKELLKNVKSSLNQSSIIQLDSNLLDKILRLTNISFDSFEIYEKQVSLPYMQTMEIIARSNQLHNEVQELTNNASLSIQEMNSKLNESYSKVESAKQNLTVLSSLYDAFPQEFNNLKTHTIEKLKNTLIRLNPQNEEKYAQICENHANDLVNKAKQLRIKFNSILLFASKYQNQTTENSYNRITDVIRNIQEIVNEIEEKVEDLFSQIYSEKESDDQAENRNKKSKLLAEEASKLNNNYLNDVQARLDQSKQQIDRIQSNMFIMDEINGNLKSRNSLLLDIEIGLNELANKSRTFKGIDELFPNTINILNAYNDKINAINSTILQDYIPRINNLKSRKALLDGNFIGEIDQIQTNIENKSKYIKSFEVRNRKMDNMHRQMHRNLNEIITKIRLARQKASTIKISIKNKPFYQINNSSINSTINLNKNETYSTLADQVLDNNLNTKNILSANNPNILLNKLDKTQEKYKLVFCKRSYESELEPSSVNSINLIFTINEQDAKNSLFLYVGSKYLNTNETLNDFYVVELVDKYIRFIWNTGNGVQVLQHPLEIERNKLQQLAKEKWYKVQVLRLASTIHLQVKQLLSINHVQDLSKTFFKNENLDYYEALDQEEIVYSADNIVRSKSLGNNIKMNFDYNSEIILGSLPDNWVEKNYNKIDESASTTSFNENLIDNNYLVTIPDEIKARQMSGCLFELNLDGHNINLWNFKTTTSACVGCKEGISEERPSNLFRFKGKYSYAMLPQINRYNNLKYVIQLNIRTFDENALLFFTCNSINGDHIILSLIEGKIRFQVVSKNALGQNIGLDLISKEKYNSGQWVYISAERDNLEGLLHVESEIIEDNVHNLPFTFSLPSYNTNLEHSITGTNVFSNYPRQLKLDLLEQNLFIGGLPLNFSSNQCSSKLQTINSFNGCMKNIQIDTTPLNLLNQVCFDVDNDCFDQLSLRIINFNADAFMEVNGQKLGNHSEISFTFKTLQKNAILLLNMFNKKNFEDHFETYYLHNHYQIMIKNGFIVVKIKASSDLDRTLVSKIILNSKYPVNNNEYHTLAIIKKYRKISLYIDDEECGTLRFSRKVYNVHSLPNSSLYIGGIPNDFQPIENLDVTQAFNGTIKDLVFNRILVDLSRKIFINSTLN